MGSKDPLGLFTAWAREYGDIFYYRALARPVYFLNHPDLIKQVLLTNPGNFIKGEALRFNRRVFGNGLLTSEGDFWLRQRRLIQPAFHATKIASYGASTVEHTMRMLGGWHDGEARDIYGEMMNLTLDIVAKTLFGLEMASDRERFAAAVHTLLDLSTGARMLLPPALRRVPTPGNLRHERAIRVLDRLVYGFISSRRQSGKFGGDLLSTLLQIAEPMPDELLRDETMTLLLAGHETTAVTLAWTWYLLAQHPEAERKLAAELDQALAGRDPGTADLPGLRYADAVIKEAVRLYPPIWALVRNPIAECEIGGYRVPPGATVVMSQWVTHRDPRFFAEPERFHPERWLDGSMKAPPKFAYFPFGGGPRACIGNAFATMESVLILATIAQRYRIELAPGFVAVPQPTITLRPRGGIQVVLRQQRG